MTFVPHKANQYRPHLIRRYGITAMLIVIILAQVGYNLSTTGTVLGEKTVVTTEALLTDTNSERAKHELQPLVLDDTLSKAAQLKAEDMLRQQYWAHTAPDGTTPWQWFKSVGYSYSFAGENLAKNFRTADAVTTAWMGSSEHQANILNAQYSQVGFAVAEGTLEGKPVTLVVALYGAPKSAQAATLGATAINSAPATNPSVGVMTRLGMAVQSMTPAALGSVVVMLIVALVAFMAHVYRNKLPKTLRQSWYRHHGLMKVGGMMSLCLIVVFLYSGGQI